MKCLKQIILLTSLIAFSASLYSQKVNVTANSIKETRSTEDRDNELEIEVSIKGIKIDENNLIRVKEFTKVQDDEGLELQKKKSFFGSSEEFQSKNTIKLTFETPSRSATMIPKIEGVLEYFTPSTDTGGKVVIDRPISKMNTRIVSDEATGVLVDFTNKQEIDNYKKKYRKDMEVALDSLKEEGELAGTLGEVAVGFLDAFEGVFSGFGSMGGDHSFYFKVEDPKEKLVEINIYNEEDKLMSNGTSKYGTIQIKSFKNEPNDEWRIEVILKNKDAVKEIPFTISNIVLP